MILGISILGNGLPEVAADLDPEILASAHELWAGDVGVYGPWSREAGASNTAGAGRVFWRSAVQTGQDLLIVGDCTSTMDAAWALEENLPDWASALAVSQGQGRGQIRRHWVSPPGNIYASIVWPKLDEKSLKTGWNDVLPVAVGHVFVKALEELGIGAMLKWPNDILVGGKKAGGILIEERSKKTIVGVGLNLSSAPHRSGLRDRTAVSAAVLPLPGAGVLGTWLTLVKRAENEYSKMLKSIALPDFLRLAEERLAWKDKRVLVFEGGDVSYQARIIGLDRKGGLVLNRNGREHILNSGSIMPL